MKELLLYLDPGTGSLIIQIIIGGIISSLLFIKTFWTRITNFFKKK